MGREDKELLLKYLPMSKELASVVKKMDWEEDAKDILLSSLRKRPNYLPTSWIDCIGSLRDPETIPDLKWFFVNASNKSWTYKSIKDIPGMDLSAEVAEIWVNADVDEWTKESMAAIAAEHGHKGALSVLIEKIESGKNQWEKREAVKAVRKLFKTKLQGQELVAWFRLHQDKISYDKNLKRFVAEGVSAEEGNRNDEVSDF
ncbi:MAG: hypothetical protein HRU15_09030 [Planctomycetes bacterium]|nr:hypothetical protein [Planctomycetota bacterium]